VCLDEVGPESAKSFPGTQLVPAVIARAEGPPQQVAGRARQEADYGRRGKGYLFGALCPATGDVLTAPYTRRTAAHWGDFLVQVEGGVSDLHFGSDVCHTGILS
jgi:hypothetical protein